MHGIVIKYGKFSSKCEFLHRDAKWLIESTNYTRKNLSNLNEDQAVLNITFRGRPHNYGDPIELYAMFECFLYLQERTTPQEIVAINSNSQSGE